MPAPKPGERLYLVDANNAVHRLYHAVPAELSPSGAHVNAVVGWVRTLRKLRKRLGAKWLIPVFDGPGDGWRKELHPGYKAARKPADEELVSQWPLVREVTEALQLPVVTLPMVEADDTIATYAELAVAAGLEVIIATADKDLLQLVRGESGPGSVRVTDLWQQYKMSGPADVVARFGVGPEILADLLGIAGDKSDSIPGIDGFGPKKAAKLLERWGSLEVALEKWEFNRLPSVRTALHDQADQARMSKRLVELDRSVPITLALEDLVPWVPSRRALDGFFDGLGYSSFDQAVDSWQR